MRRMLMMVGVLSVMFGANAGKTASGRQTEKLETFSVGCVNCGAFKYGGGRASPKRFAEEWRRLAKDYPQDAFL